MAGKLHVGVGGWTFAPWRGPFYPKGLPQKQELAHASRALTSIEINATYYSRFKRESWARWRDETPPGFVFAVKASRFCTNRRELAGAGEAIAGFFAQGLAALGDRLGPINWQFGERKQFEPEDFAAFLALLPREVEGIALRHALEVRHPSFMDERFHVLARKHRAAIVLADHDEFPRIDEATADFTYARLMRTQERIRTGYDARALDRWAAQAKRWTARGDAFVYFISGAKRRAPAAAMALLERADPAHARGGPAPGIERPRRPPARRVPSAGA